MPTSRTLAALALCAAPLAACSVARAPAVAAGYVSHELCGGVFISGQDPKTFYADQIGPTLGVADHLVSARVDRPAGTVTASFAGVVTRTAVYRGPLGCLVLNGPAPSTPAPKITPPAAPPLQADIAGPDVVAPVNPALKAAIDRAFEETPRPPNRRTRAIVVVWNGKVVGERYAPGYGPTTPIQGWSMTKSVTNALLGVLVRQGRLSMTAPAPVAAWRDPVDPRHPITPDNLLRMQSGLDAGQSLTSNTGTAFDPTAYMVFATADMDAFAEHAVYQLPAGGRWTYTNVNTLLLSRIIRDQAGGDAAAALAFAHRELFDKLGMRNVTLEFDQAGTPIGASHMWAPARDWARFGLLYLNDGVAGGQRILPEGWADYSARMTPGSEDFGYGAGFWTNRGHTGGAAYRIARGMPADSYFARGSQGQVIIIIPSAHMVIVRMGFATNEREDMPTIARLTGEAIAALGASTNR